MFDDQEITELWEQAVAEWRGQYSIGDAEKALRMEFRRRHKCHPVDADVEVLRKFLVEVREGAVA